MRIIDFKKLEVKTQTEYETIVFNFELNNKLEMGLFPFTKMLAKDMEEKIKAAKLEDYADKNVLFEFRTDLRNMDLDPMIPQLLTSFVLALKLDKTTWKHGEKILGVPRQLMIDKGYLMDANALDLINYNLPIEKFNIIFFNNRGRGITSVLARVE